MLIGQSTVNFADEFTVNRSTGLFKLTLGLALTLFLLFVSCVPKIF